MNAHTLLNRLAKLDVTRNQARVLMSLSTRGKTIPELAEENPDLPPDCAPRMLKNGLLKRTKQGRSFLYRLTEDGFNVARLIFEAETETETTSTPDSPELPNL